MGTAAASSCKCWLRNWLRLLAGDVSVGDVSVGNASGERWGTAACIVVAVVLGDDTLLFDIVLFDIVPLAVLGAAPLEVGKEVAGAVVAVVGLLAAPGTNKRVPVVTCVGLLKPLMRNRVLSDTP